MLCLPVDEPVQHLGLLIVGESIAIPSTPMDTALFGIDHLNGLVQPFRRQGKVSAFRFVNSLLE